MAAMTSHTEGSAKPPSASRIGVPLATIAVRPSSTRADAGSGSMIMPTITQHEDRHLPPALRRDDGRMREQVGDRGEKEGEGRETPDAGHDRRF